MTHPNIDEVIADQLARQFTGAYGYPIAKTAHFDALTKRAAIHRFAHRHGFSLCQAI